MLQAQAAQAQAVAAAASDWFNCNFSLLPHNQFFFFLCNKNRRKKMRKNYCNRTNMFYTARRHMLQLIMPYAPSRGVPHAASRMPHAASRSASWGHKLIKAESFRKFN